MKKIRVVLALITQDNDYQREQASAADAAARRLGIDLRVLYADGDAIAQTRQLLALVRPGATDCPDAIIAEPVGTSMPQVARTAVSNGVGWVVLNREADDIAELRRTATVPIGCVNTDNLEVGRIQGRQFAALLPSGGTVLYIEGPATDVARERRAGVEETRPANIEIKALRGKWTEESGYQVVSSRLQLQWSQAPNVGIIGSQNDAMAMGARRAVEGLTAAQQREQWLKIPFTGCDGVPTSGQVWVRRGLLAATVITPVLAGLALELVAKAVANGTQMPERTLSPPTSFPPIEALRARA
jgi:ribose transport system substrate-binding protein